MQDHDDETLVRLFQEGDARAFDEIVRRYRPKMCRVAERVLSNHADADDVVQQSLVSAWRSLGRFRGECSFSTWLFTITKRRAFNRYKSRWMRQRKASISLDAKIGESEQSAADSVACKAPQPGDECETTELADSLTRGLERLSEEHREVLILRTVHHHSYEHIAAVRSIPVGTVKSKLSRARASLRMRVNQEVFA